MPVFDFSGAPAEKTEAVCTYTTFLSSAKEKSPQEPILVLENKERKWAHHTLGIFTNQTKRTAFEFKEN